MPPLDIGLSTDSQVSQVIFSGHSFFADLWGQLGQLMGQCPDDGVWGLEMAVHCGEALSAAVASVGCHLGTILDCVVQIF